MRSTSGTLVPLERRTRSQTPLMRVVLPPGVRSSWRTIALAPTGFAVSPHTSM